MEGIDLNALLNKAPEPVFEPEPEKLGIVDIAKLMQDAEFVQKHMPEFTPEQVSSVQEWFSGLASGEVNMPAGVPLRTLVAAGLMPREVAVCLDPEWDKARPALRARTPIDPGVVEQDLDMVRDSLEENGAASFVVSNLSMLVPIVRQFEEEFGTLEVNQGGFVITLHKEG